MDEENKNNNTEDQKTNDNNNQSKEQNNNNQVNTKEIGEKAISDYLNTLGVDSESLNEILKKHKEDEERNKTDIEKKDGELQKALSQLSQERKARILAEAKLSALKLGAKVDLVDDLVTIASAKVTKDKDVESVLSEIKGGVTGNIYFQSEEDNKEKEQNQNRNITRKNVGEKNKEGEKKDDNHRGTFASRLVSSKRKESHYFKK